MTWGKVDDNLAFHPKVMAAGNTAMGLWVRALSYSCQQLTDGFVSDSIVFVLGDAETANALVKAGLWHQEPGGFQFNDWAEYQPTREQVLADRIAAKERMARVRGQKRSDDVRANFDRSSVTPTRPDPTQTTSKDVVTRAKRIPDDFHVTDDMTVWADREVPGLNVRLVTAMFIDYWQAASGRTSVKKDWVATWRVWMRREFMQSPATRQQAEQSAAFERTRQDRDQRVRQQQADALAQAEINDRLRAEPIPECKHGLTIARCVPCALELADAGN